VSAALLRLATGPQRRHATASYVAAHYCVPAVQAALQAPREPVEPGSVRMMLATARHFLRAARAAQHSGVRAGLLGSAAHYRRMAQRERRAA